MRVEEEKECRNHHWQSLGDGGYKSINSLGSGRGSVVSGSPRLMKGVGGGQKRWADEGEGGREEVTVVMD